MEENDCVTEDSRSSSLKPVPSLLSPLHWLLLISCCVFKTYYMLFVCLYLHMPGYVILALFLCVLHCSCTERLPHLQLSPVRKLVVCREVPAHPSCPLRCATGPRCSTPCSSSQQHLSNSSGDPSTAQERAAWGTFAHPGDCLELCSLWSRPLGMTRAFLSSAIQRGGSDALQNLVVYSLGMVKSPKEALYD